MSHFRQEWLTIAVSGVLTAFGTAAEAAGLVLTILLAGALSSGESETFDPSLGSFTLELSFNQIALLAAGLLAISAVGRIAANYVVTRRRTELARQWRNELISGFLGVEQLHVEQPVLAVVGDR